MNVGDSVSKGIFGKLGQMLTAAPFWWEIFHPASNDGGGCGNTVRGRDCTDFWLEGANRSDGREWNVITFNYGLHDGADSNATYLAEITSIADQLVEVAKSAKPAGAAHSTALVYFATTHSDGGVVPGEPVSASNKRVLELNAIAAEVMAARSIPIVDLFQTMNECGAPCDAVSASSPVLSPS
jgi:hypothetical protein